MDIEKYLNESQDPETVEKAIERVSELITNEEEIKYVAVQEKPIINLSPTSIVLTNRRIIVCKQDLFGLTMDFKDYLWKRIGDCHMSENIFGANFTVKQVKGYRIISVNFLPRSQARSLYRYAQEQEEKMEEYRRKRELENSRAKAGGVTLNTKPNQSELKTEEKDSVAKLKKLKELLENELISQEEFDKKKDEIISNL